MSAISELENIKNFVQLTDQIATAGQPRDEQFEQIANAGYRYVINLGLPNHVDAVADEDVQLAALGVTYIHIPVKFDAPSKEQVKFFCQILATLKGEQVFVHCIMNYRVSAFMYHYLTKVENYSDSAARSSMFESWEMPPAWQELMTWTAEDLDLT